jgi:hypothetical protein
MPPKNVGIYLLGQHNGKLYILGNISNISYKKGRIDTNGGRINRGEQPNAAAVRELYEETGIILDKNIIKLFYKTDTLYCYAVLLKRLIKAPGGTSYEIEESNKLKNLMGKSYIDMNNRQGIVWCEFNKFIKKVSAQQTFNRQSLFYNILLRLKNNIII